MKAATHHISRIAQLGERQTEDLKVTCSIHVSGIHFLFFAFCCRHGFCFCILFVLSPLHSHHSPPKLDNNVGEVISVASINIQKPVMFVPSPTFLKSLGQHNSIVERKKYLESKKECQEGHHPDLLLIGMDAKELLQLPHFGVVPLPLLKKIGIFFFLFISINLVK